MTWYEKILALLDLPLYTLVWISTPITTLNPYGKISAMSFQGQDFTPAMKQLVVNLKLHFDEERKHSKAVSTRNLTLRTAQGLDIGESTVKSIMAAYRHPGHIRTAHAATPRGKPEYRAAVNLQPVIREYVRTKNWAGQRVGVGQLYEYDCDEISEEEWAAD